MPEEMTSIRIEVNQEELKLIDEIKEKERWSRVLVVKVALENYLKLRSARNED